MDSSPCRRGLWLWECVKLTLVLNLETTLDKTPGLLVCTACEPYHTVHLSHACARQLHAPSN